MLRHVESPDGVRIACEISGQGPALVLVHGAGSARSGFEPLRPLLEGSFRVVALDRRGRGDSGDAEREYSLESEFGDVAAVMADAGEVAVLLGHSYGALLAAGAASLVPRLDRLVLYEPPMGGVLAGEGWIERYERQLEGGRRAAAVTEFLRHVGGYSEAEIAAMQDTHAWSMRLAAAPTVPRELRAEQAFALDSLGLGRLRTSCLMLLGSQSPAWAQRSTDAYAAALADVRVERLEGHGHGGVVSASELVSRLVADFGLG